MLATADVTVGAPFLGCEGLTVGAGQLALQVLKAQAESKHFRSVTACGGADKSTFFFARKVRAGIPMVVPFSFSRGTRVQNGCAATGEGPLHRSVGPQLQIRLFPPSDRGLSCRLFLLAGIVVHWKTVRVGAGCIDSRGSMLLHVARTLRWGAPMSDDSGKHLSAHSFGDPPRSWARR